MSRIESTDNQMIASLRRRVMQWRVLAGIALVVAIAFFFDVVQIGQKHVARVEVFGVIFEDHPRHNLLRELAEDDDVRAVIVHINSPGGTITGSEELYQDLRQLANEKPVVAVMSEAATSGGYIAALGADYIFARQTSVTGSVGVLFQWFEFTELAKKIGVKPHALRSGELKAQPDIFGPPSEKILRVERELIKEGFDWFVALVAERRNLDRASLLKIAGDGRVFSGAKAAQLRLIDAIGGLSEARDWLENERDIAADLPLIDHEPKYPDEGVLSWFLSGILSKTLKMVGMDLISLAPERRGFGLMAIWWP